MNRILVVAFAAFLALAPLAEAKSFTSLARMLQASTVQLMNTNRQGFCSGWSIDRKRDFVITAEHCVSFKGALNGITVDGVVADVVFTDTVSDVAVLHVAGLDRPEIKPELFSTLRVGQDAGRGAAAIVANGPCPVE